MRDFDRPRAAKINQPAAEILEERIAMSTTIAHAGVGAGTIDLADFALWSLSQEANQTAINHFYGMALKSTTVDDVVSWELLVYVDDTYNLTTNMRTLLGINTMGTYIFGAGDTDPLVSITPVCIETVDVQMGTDPGVSIIPVIVDDTTPSYYQNSLTEAQTLLSDGTEIGDPSIYVWFGRNEMGVLAQWAPPPQDGD